ncbi:hypothetical protein [Mucilaginibacter ginkgonis]|uniref:Uncharacterized protein n=1 Tax=Mucilaginibacter ginkgonis TaxID=2682091 RepID=A0A6I4I204_9SPHI|nr:hypothetical protein [Mucilaginibacter ginkgonis]QQL50824.1 hypothetical protein GO620_005025 [Mucilaginibacter ginkgonis]
MNTENSNNPDPNNNQIADTDSGKKSGDTLNENTGADTEISKGTEPNVQDKPDETRVETVTPGFEKGDAGAPEEDKPDANKGQSGSDTPSSNKGQGPLGENL